jgi:uncharacterized membrane protein
LLYGARAFLMLAMAVSLYLAWVSLTHGKAVGCGPESGCDRVLQSRWAYWLGIPVSLFALGVDGFLLGWTFRLHEAGNPLRQQRAWQWILPGAWMVVGAALWFVALQLFVVKAICPYCMLAHASGFSAAVLLLRSAPRAAANAKQRTLPPSLGRSLGVAGAALAVLVLGQLAYRPATGVMTAAPNASAPSSQAPAGSQSSNRPTPAPAVAGSSTAAPATKTAASVPTAASASRRLHSIYGRFEVNLLEAPVIGSPTNEQVMVSLFDYTCHHCREMHATLVEAQRIFSNRLVILSLPMPLDPGCNPTMSRPHPAHTNACEYARLGLTVWRADRAKHHEFDEYLFTGQTPPPLIEAQQRALNLVGPSAFAMAARDPWVQEQLDVDVGIYQMAYNSQKGQMPQLILGNSLAMGTYPLDELLQHLETYLGLKRGP